METIFNIVLLNDTFQHLFVHNEKIHITVDHKKKYNKDLGPLFGTAVNWILWFLLKSVFDIF